MVRTIGKETEYRICYTNVNQREEVTILENLGGTVSVVVSGTG
jgi:hypothetical protein